MLGSKDELAGCQLCQATIAEDGSLTLKLRLPDALVEQQKVLQKAISPVITIKGVRFAYFWFNAGSFMGTCKTGGGCGRPWQGPIKDEFKKQIQAVYTYFFNPVSLHDG